MLPTPELEIARNLPVAGCAPTEAERYTRWLATHHYENFNVVTRLLPKELHQHFYNVYAYCRWSDDLGDEVASPARAVELLDAWEDELKLIYAGAGSVASRVDRSFANDSREKCPDHSVQRSTESFSTGPDRAALPDLGRRFRLLRLLGQPGRPPCSLSVWLSRRSAPETFRRHLHGAAAREFLAGCVARPGKRTHLHSARSSRKAPANRRRHRESALRCAIRRVDERPDRTHT